MANPECPQFNTSQTPTRAELMQALTEIDNRLEFVDANENIIERLNQGEELMEIRSWLEEELDVMTDDIFPTEVSGDE